MSDLPNAKRLADLVSGVTHTMFGISFSLDGAEADPFEEEPAWRTVALQIAGRRHLTVAIASDRSGGAALGGVMFSCPAADVDASMVDDSLSELVNIVAGQVKSSMGLDEPLGLPSVMETPQDVHAEAWRSATLRRDGGEAVRVWVAIREKAA
jgi:hypothetical protein